MNRITLAFFALVTAAALLVACGPPIHEDEELARIELVDRGADGRPVVATWTEADGWTGSGLPDINLQSENQRISIGVRAIAEDGDDLIEEDDHFFARYFLAPGAADDIVDMDVDAELFHGDHIHIYGAAVGTTQIVIDVWHDDHSEWATDPITITVIDEE